MNGMETRYSNEDQILIPSKNGFISIPAKGLRSEKTNQTQKAQTSLSLISMKVKNYLPNYYEK